MSLSRSMPSLSILPILFPLLVAAIPAADPLVTPLAHLAKRDNGANVIGFSSSGTGWRTRSCNTGFFSTSGTLGNCCPNGSCNFVTNCIGSYLYFATGSAANCGNICYTGTIYHTPGDLFPLSMYNCDSNWIDTMTPFPSTSTPAVPATVTSVQTTGTTATATITQSNVASASSASSVVVVGNVQSSVSSDVSASQPATSAVTLTVTNSNGQPTTQVTIIAAGASGTSSSSTNTATAVPLHNKTSTNTGIIAGATVGGIAIVVLIAIAALLFFRLRSKKAASATPTTNNNENLASNVGAQPPNGGPYPQGQPPRFSQVEYMNNPPAMAHNGVPAYPQQNQPYGVYAPPMAVAQQDWKPDGSRGVVEANVMPVGPMTPPPGVQEVYGSPVERAVEMPVYGR